MCIRDSIPSLLVIQGVLNPEFWIWDPNLRIAVPIFLTHLIYLKREQRLKMLALELDQKNEQLREVDRYKDLFLERTSHELRTPLNAIIGFGENLLESARELTRFQQKKIELDRSQCLADVTVDQGFERFHPDQGI